MGYLFDYSSFNHLSLFHIHLSYFCFIILIMRVRYALHSHSALRFFSFQTRAELAAQQQQRAEEQKEFEKRRALLEAELNNKRAIFEEKQRKRKEAEEAEERERKKLERAKLEEQKAYYEQNKQKLEEYYDCMLPLHFLLLYSSLFLSHFSTFSL